MTGADGGVGEFFLAAGYDDGGEWIPGACHHSTMG